jgi:hypothetical protein
MTEPAPVTANTPTGTARGVWKQLRELRGVLALVYIPLLLGIGALVVVNLVADIPLRSFFTDPVTEFAAPMYIGLVSNFGVVLWGSAASVCLFGGWLLLRSPGTQPQAMFLLASGAFSGLLMFDDLYLLHEEILPERLHIPQPLVFVGYGALLLAFLLRFRRLILDSDYALLVLAGGFFAVSVCVDLVVTTEELYLFGDFAVRELIEDGCKVLGIAAWTTYFWRVATRTVGAVLAGKP